MRPSLARLVTQVWAEFCRFLAAEIHPYRVPFAPTRPPAATFLRSESMILVYRITPAVSTDPNVAFHKILPVVGGAAQPEILIGAGSTAEFRVEGGNTFSLTQYDISAAGVEGPAGPPFEAVAVDTLPPPPAGTPTVELIGKE